MSLLRWFTRPRKQITAGISISGKLIDKPSGEKATVVRWLEHNHISYTGADLKPDPEHSDIDIRFKDWNFQITKPPTDEFLRDLSISGSASYDDVNSNRFTELITTAVKKKIAKSGRKEEIILLIDGHPLDLPAALLTSRSRKQLRKLRRHSGFKEIWFVGVGPDYIFNLHS